MPPDFRLVVDGSDSQSLFAMAGSTRRDFLKTTAAGTLALRTLPEVAAAPSDRSGRPAHRSIEVPGVHGYASSHSVAAGGRIDFFLSADRAFQLRMVRLGLEVDDRASDRVEHDAGSFPASVQPIHPGSYVHIPSRLRTPLKAITLECWVHPWSVDRLAGLLTQEDKTSDEGFALGLGPKGYVGFFLGNGVGPDEVEIHRSATGVIQTGRWYHIVGRWDGTTKDLWVNGECVGRWPFAGPFVLGSHPLRLGAMGERGVALRFLDGDLAQSAIYGFAVSDETIRRRFSERGLVPARGRGVLASWDFHEERGDRVADGSSAQRHGQIVNRGTWMIGGPSFDPEVPRFESYDPAKDARRGHALRLASDDLYDCGWLPTWTWSVPSRTPPGIYSARVQHQQEGSPREYDITFIVRKAPRSRPARLLVLCSTNTWRAYNAAPFGVWPATSEAVIGTDGLPNSPGDPPAFSFYRRHAAGQGTYQVGLRMPWPVAGPRVFYGGPTRYSHLMRAERFLQTWLERNGYRFDLATDDDLHRTPGLLRDYRVVVLNGHSEYWSLPMLGGLERFQNAGGNLVVFSGNSLFWRVSFDPEMRVMECRKVDAPGNQMLPRERGECWHSLDGLRGGLLRDCGHPGWKYVGLETLGWNNQSNPKNFGPYIATQTDHFLFHQPEETGLRPGDRFGQGLQGGLPLANGHEFDVRLSTLKALEQEPPPAGVSVPPDPAGIVALANGVIPWKEGGSAFDYFFRPIQPATDQGGEMIYWERPEGGRVFNAGSIGSGWALAADPQFQTLLRNVLAFFGAK